MGDLQKKIVNSYTRIRNNGDYGCKGGVYNPGAIYYHGQIYVIFRAEKDYTFSDAACGYVLERLSTKDLSVVDSSGWVPTNGRVEDIRLHSVDGFWVEGFATVHDDDGVRVENIDIAGNKIAYKSSLGIPVHKIEKNWMKAGGENDTYIIYSLDPLRIYSKGGYAMVCDVDEDSGWAQQHKGFLSMSTMPLMVSHGIWLGFYHVIENGEYKHGAYLLDIRNNKIIHKTGFLFGSEFCGRDVWKQNCIYVSSAVFRNGEVLLFCGEGDSHSGVISLDKELLLDELYKNPLVQEQSYKIRFDDWGIGDFICAMYAIQNFCSENPHLHVKLYIKNSGIVGLCSLFDIHNLKAYHEETHKRPKYDTILNGNGRQSVYNEKLKGSFKKWYANKLNTEIKVPKLRRDYSADFPGLHKHIVIAPFAAHANRNWAKANWVELINILLERGEQVVVVDSDASRLNGFPGQHYVNMAYDSLFWIVGSAKKVICNESGIAHIAGLLGVDTLILSGWLNPELVYDETNVKYIYKSSLNDIGVNDVMERLYPQS